MAKLILSFEGTVLKTVPLNKERITLGRRPENDIQVDNLAVSGEHAVVTTILNDSVIEDLGSTNGTMVNGQLVQKHLLQPNDIIELGKHKLKYLVDAPAAKPYTNFDKTMVIRRPNAAATAPAQAPSAVGTGTAPMQVDDMPQTMNMAPVAPPRPAMVAPVAQAVVAAPVRAPVNAPAAPVREAAIQILSGSAAGRVLDLNKSLTTIGKTGIQVAVITRRPTGFFVTHVEGDAFPLFNGAPLGAQARQLSEDDTIEIAGIKMSFFYKP